ncbi:MAG: ATP-binding protein [Thermodesulfobacteriota bacterium]|nr:ATP-binding protein [Thermodesulfobacteriota bacterium]
MLIRVTDNGPGVNHALREEIFQPFFSTKSEGNGLGLSIARRIVEEHGGRLNLLSPFPDGAAFIIILPARETWAWTKS